jgi:hypothetical protein
MRPFLPRGILLVVVFLSFFVPAFAQDAASGSANGAPSPFDVSIVPTTQADYDACGSAGFIGKTTIVGLQMRNNGVKPLRGYVVAVWYHDVGSRYVTHDTVSRLIHPGDQMIMPGAEWHATACGMSKAADLEDPKAQVDLLMYADGSTWGPVELPESSRLDGVSIGMNFAAGGDDRERGYVTATPEPGSFTGQAVSGDGDSSPLQFGGVVNRDDTGQVLVWVQATNMGAVPVIGYEYRITFYDHASGNVDKNVTTKALETHGNAADYLQPNATWVSGGRKVPTSSDGQLDTYTVTLDEAVLEDGTVVGPRRSREADELIGMIEGIGAMKSPNGAQ